MNLEGPVELVFDTSVIIGAVLENYHEEAGCVSRNALNSIIERCHILRISEEIEKECRKDLMKRGLPPHLILPILFGPLEPKGKIKRLSVHAQ